MRWLDVLMAHMGRPVRPDHEDHIDTLQEHSDRTLARVERLSKQRLRDEALRAQRRVQGR